VAPGTHIVYASIGAEPVVHSPTALWDSAYGMCAYGLRGAVAAVWIAEGAWGWPPWSGHPQALWSASSSAASLSNAALC